MNERATPAEAVDATRRTRLASERTELAWWRTGLTALAVALAVGRVIPSLDHNSADWLYDLAGVCFGVYGRFPDPPRRAHAALALSGVALGLLTILIVVIS